MEHFPFCPQQAEFTAKIGQPPEWQSTTSPKGTTTSEPNTHTSTHTLALFFPNPSH